ncbi:hypothetical protein ACJMK2_037400, partial [Sinanodonta woodiana]
NVSCGMSGTSSELGGRITCLPHPQAPEEGFDVLYSAKELLREVSDEKVMSIK